MKISDIYNVKQIIVDLEVALQIDGNDYAEKNVDTILLNIKKRIIRQYQVDLNETKIYDPSLQTGRNIQSVNLFIENMMRMHSLLCGYLQIARYTGDVIIKPSNVNYLGYNDSSLMGLFQVMLREKTMPAVDEPIEAIKQKIGAINNCPEKRLILILIVSYDLGFYEIVAAISEILYLGGKV